jgi:twitching motility protein PilU
MKSLMAKSNEQGMITFDQALFNLFEEGAITYEDGLRNADSVNDLRLRVKLESKAAKSADLMDEVGHLQMEEEPEDSGLMR